MEKNIITRDIKSENCFFVILKWAANFRHLLKTAPLADDNAPTTSVTKIVSDHTLSAMYAKSVAVFPNVTAVVQIIARMDT